MTRAAFAKILELDKSAISKAAARGANFGADGVVDTREPDTLRFFFRAWARLVQKYIGVPPRWVVLLAAREEQRVCVAWNPPDESLEAFGITEIDETGEHFKTFNGFVVDLETGRAIDEKGAEYRVVVQTRTGAEPDWLANGPIGSEPGVARGEKQISEGGIDL